MVLIVKRDPIENDPKIKKLIDRAYEEAEEILANHERRGKVGFSKLLAGKVKEILKNKYRIDWKTPSEMNPGLKFD